MLDPLTTLVIGTQIVPCWRTWIVWKSVRGCILNLKDEVFWNAIRASIFNFDDKKVFRKTSVMSKSPILKISLSSSVELFLNLDQIAISSKQTRPNWHIILHWSGIYNILYDDSDEYCLHIMLKVIKIKTTKVLLLK